MAKPDKELSIDIPNDLVKELLTDSEWRMLKQRLMIMDYLSRSWSVRKIAKKVGVGTDTVVRMSKKFKESEKLKNNFKRPESSLTSKWVFGQISSEKE